MPKRSITDEEIALIKALKLRGMKTKDVQFLFNRQDRPVNTGRIKEIERGKYGPSASISAASDATVDAFISGFSALPISAPATVAAVGASAAAGPVAVETLASLFVRDGNLWRLHAGESDEHECKKSFGFTYRSGWLRAVAALANNRGGYVLFGVHDKDKDKIDGIDLSYAVVGLADTVFENADLVEFTKCLKDTFDPTPILTKAMLLMDGMKVGILYVEPHPSRPIIATKHLPNDIKEGDIFYRYPAQSSRIKYSDLRTLLDARDSQTRHQLIPLIEKLIQLGPERVLLADLQTGSLGDGKRTIQMNDALIEKLKFIKEGEFDERTGAPTLKLIGEIEAQGRSLPLTKMGFISQDDLISGFLNQEMKSDPKEYIRAAIEGAQAEWVPIHYFAANGGMNSSELIEFIRSTKPIKGRKALFINRVQGKTSAYQKARGAGLEILLEIQAGNLPDTNPKWDASAIGAAIQGLEAAPTVPQVELLSLLSRCVEENTGHQGVTSILRRAICRLDEVMFRQPLRQ